jgi:hypothetical protein
MVEECKEGLKEKFADNKGDAAGAKQDDARRSRFLCRHKYFTLDSLFDNYHMTCGMESKKQILNISGRQPHTQSSEKHTLKI